MNSQKIENTTDQNVSTAAATGGMSKSKRNAPARVSGKVGTKSKRDQLIALLSKPNGARASLIYERLGWQAHTVRAAVSGLRKCGFEIVNSKSQKTGETVYAIKVRAGTDAGELVESST